MVFVERHMLSQQQQQQLQQQTVVMDASLLVTDDAREPVACNHRAPPVRPIITRTDATPLPAVRGNSAASAAAAAATGLVDDGAPARENNSSESFATSLAGYSETLSYEASYLSPAAAVFALCYAVLTCEIKLF